MFTSLILFVMSRSQGDDGFVDPWSRRLHSLVVVVVAAAAVVVVLLVLVLVGNEDDCVRRADGKKETTTVKPTISSRMVSEMKSHSQSLCE
jgi:hypothetical protein